MDRRGRDFTLQRVTDLLPIRQVSEQFNRRKKHLIVLVALGGLIYLVTWLSCQDYIPTEIRIATGPDGGMYHKLGEEMAARLRAETGHEAVVQTTHGSLENIQRLYADRRDDLTKADGDAERAYLAIIQAGTHATPEDTNADINPFTNTPAGIFMHRKGTRLLALAPLYDEWILFVARKDAGIHEIPDLAGKEVAIGPPGSGMRYSADAILKHYGMTAAHLLNPDRTLAHMLTDAAPDGERRIQAAIVTTGPDNATLHALLATGDFEILPIAQSAAIDRTEPFLFEVTLPPGTVMGWPPQPAIEVRTLSTTAVLVAREDAPGPLVSATLTALYDRAPDLRNRFPLLKSKSFAKTWADIARHSSADGYFDPYEGIGIMANFMESASAFKDLLFGLVIIAVAAWRYWAVLQRRGRAAELAVQHEQLDTLIDQTLAVEREQRETDDPAELRALMDRVVEIKISGIESLTHEDVRGDRRFVVFLMQCSHLISQIQARLTALSLGHAPPAAVVGPAATNADWPTESPFGPAFVSATGRTATAIHHAAAVPANGPRVGTSIHNRDTVVRRFPATAMKAAPLGSANGANGNGHHAAHVGAQAGDDAALAEAESPPPAIIALPHLARNRSPMIPASASRHTHLRRI